MLLLKLLDLHDKLSFDGDHHDSFFKADPFTKICSVDVHSTLPQLAGAGVGIMKAVAWGKIL